MDLGLKEKVVIVTGGSKGIGGAITDVLVEEGATVVIAGRASSDGEKKVRELGNLPGKVEFFKIELTDETRRDELIKHVADRYGRIDGLVNNAGVNDSVGLRSASVEEFLDSYHRNVVHVFSLVKKALPFLQKTKGSVVNIGSKVADTGQGNTSGYAASKGAINALTREWALDLAPDNIRVNCVIPAEVWTPLYDRWINTLPNPKEKMEEIVSRIPFQKRFTTSREIANMTVFLLSNKVSGHTTGQIVYVDGGYTHLDRAFR